MDLAVIEFILFVRSDSCKGVLTLDGVQIAKGVRVLDKTIRR